MTTNTSFNTLYLNSLMENEGGKQALDKALSTYPLYEGKKKYDLIPTREELNNKLLNHYRFREIAFETAGRFLFELEQTMCLIMPKYNELFKTVEIMADLENPFDNVDMVETFEEKRTNKNESEGTTTNTTNEESEGTTNATQTSTGLTDKNETTNNTTTATDTGKNISKVSDTPQNSVSNINNYLSEYREEDNQLNNTTTAKDTTTSNVIDESETISNGSQSNTLNATSNGTSQSTLNSTGTTTHTHTRKGNQGVNTYAHDMIEFRTSIVDYVDELINDERIAELFMLVY